ncbi:hypothetical protein AQUCO_03800006v1 [Aquilegia coerulea]|uniref:Patatin n=1 Tax=Aquilegia coerulea TaxID=218851 RepID=A0A2G5CS55_AQUCA|nr:hypothetical protein AQUCO_03800006v1 [Aquilegia coerulea]
MASSAITFPAKGKLIRVLSIDGGGVKGLIPGVMLEYLESQLQELDGEDVRLADYFDVVTGTSTGGLIATMITAPNPKNRPFYAAKDIVPFYLEHCPKIFPQKNNVGLLGMAANVMDAVKAINGPKYDGKYLRTLLQEFLPETKLNQTLTPVIIPTFDIKHLQPIIFSTFEADRDELKNPLLSDVCISTSAAPIFLPAHHFKTSNSKKEERCFNLIDGGVAANNPTLIAMSMITRELLMQKQRFFASNPLDYGRFPSNIIRHRISQRGIQV